MTRYYYDFHIHSCLSPCGDDDNTPNNICGMATLAGLNVLALTDHNTCKNCPAFFEAAKRNGIIPIAGMELTTSEDIHVVFLFEELENALRFSEEIENHLIKIENRPEIFGRQLIMNGQDEVIGEEKYLLSNATDISIDDCPRFAESFEGICYPAHIDRDANGVVSTLGVFPDNEGFNAFELHDGEKEEAYRKSQPLKNRIMLVGSDAHYLWDIRDKEHFFEINDEPYSSKLVRNQIFNILRQKK